MRLGIRSKMVLLLAGIALLPLIGALVVLVVGSVRLRIQSVQQKFLAVANAEARGLETALASDLQQLEVVIRRPEVVEELARERPPRDAETRARIDRDWGIAPDDDPLLLSILEGPGHDALQFLRHSNPRLAEIFITDRHGELVASTNKTTDFYQADEGWWVGAYDGGRGRVFIPPVSLDESTRLWSVDLCVPIRKGSDVIGICKAVVDISRWIGDLSRFQANIGAAAMLVAPDGTILHRTDGVPSASRTPETTVPLPGAPAAGWRITGAGEVQAYSPVELQAQDVGQSIRMPAWYLVLWAEETTILGALYRIAFLGACVGIVVIAVLFLAGTWLIDRNVVRRLLAVAKAARRVAKGDLETRVGADAEARWHDEIEALGTDFDHMVDEVAKSYRDLEAAHELKKTFLRVAAHELRTPISYIVGVSRLLSKNEDVARLKEALRSIGSRAERLNAITQAMFKLLPEGELARDVERSDIETGPFLEDVRRQVEGFLGERRQRLEVRVEDVPTFRADRAKMQDILENLLTNAIKFTPDGGTITVCVRRDPTPEAEATGGDRVLFSVTDRGPGIPPAELAHMFQPFYSGGDVLQHSTGQAGFQKRGIGLGLAIVRYFAQLHGGTASVTSTPHGSTFTVAIPMRQPEE